MDINKVIQQSIPSSLKHIFIYISSHKAAVYNGNSADNFYGRATGQIWIDEIGCDGTESTVFDCTSSTYGSHDCGHHEDAGVRCDCK